MHKIYDTDTNKWIQVASDKESTYIGSMRDHTVVRHYEAFMPIREMSPEAIDTMMRNYYLLS